MSARKKNELKSIFWMINNSWSRKCLVNFIIGSRGKGKTFALLKKAFNRFIKEGKQFVYIRRYREEMKKAKSTFGQDHQAEGLFEEHEFKVDGDKFYIDGKIAGRFFTLSTQSNLKSVALPLADTIIFDEFTIDPKERYKRYLPYEVDMFVNMVETIIRLRDEGVYIYCLGNAFKWHNPYFMFFKIKKPYGKKKIFVRDDLLLVELAEGGGFEEAKRATRWGRLIDGTTMGRHIIDNEFIRDSEDFICSPPKKMHYFFTIKAMGQRYGLYIAPEEGYMYVSDKYEKDYPLTYVTMLDNHEPNTMLMRGTKSPPFKRFIKEFRNANIRYSSQKVQDVIYDGFIKGGF